jgi:type IV pilus biogenesis protein CpaD/CtpE
MRAVLAALFLIALAGCTLVDQRSFQREGAAPGAQEVARAGAAAQQVVAVRLGDPAEAWRRSVADAVQAAAQRTPGAAFDVMALVPLRGEPAEQDRRVAEASRDARAVAEVLGAAGIPAERVRLGLQGDPGSPARDVRVFQR